MNNLENANLQEQLPAALANVMQHAYRPRFLAKLAALGTVPSNNEEAEALVTLGLKLAEMGAPVPAETPAPEQPAVANKFAAALDGLNTLQYSSEELAAHQRKLAAVQLAQDPTIYASAFIARACDQAAAAPAA